MNSLSIFTRACLSCIAAIIIGTPILLLLGGRVAELARAAWADGVGLCALLVLAILALLKAVRE